jgi:hypothetical protein
LFDRVIQQQRKSAAESPSSGPEDSSAPEAGAEATRLAEVERRISDLESMLESLQDSVHREAVRVSDDIDALTRRTRPAEILRAVNVLRRENGL